MNLLSNDLAAAAMILLIAAVRAVGIHRLPAQIFTVLWGLVWLKLMLPNRVLALPVSASISPIDGTEAPWNKLLKTLGPKTAGPIADGAAPAAEAVSASGQADPLWQHALHQAAVWWPTARLAIALLLMLLVAAAYARWYRRFRFAAPAPREHTEEWLRVHPLRRPLRIVQSRHIDSPLTYGLFKPAIVLPADTNWTERECLEDVLTHEYMHIRRLDALSKMLLLAVLCLHWYNPLVWLMYILAGRDLELGCDRAVVRSRNYVRKGDYARTLIHMEERKASRLSPLNHFNQSSTEERIEHIMKMKKSSFKQIISAAAAIGLVTTALAATSVSAQASASLPAQTQTGHQAYQAGQSWTVDGEWSFKVDSVKEVAVKNSARDKEEGYAGHYVVVNYSYTNLGFDDSANFEDGIGSELSFSKANFSVTDARNADNLASGNPGPFRYPGLDAAVGVKKGETVKGAAWIYIFEKSPKAVKLSVGHYDSRLKLHEAEFVVPVVKK